MVRSRVGVSEYATSVVRLFPDYAESVIWFRGPVPYEDTRLDPRLIADLRAWDASYYAGLTADLAWRAAGVEAAFHAEGARLARRLADQIGDDFQVEHDLGESHRRVRGAGPPRNPDAAAAFAELARVARAEWDGRRAVVERARRDGETLEWRAEP
ncbi:hypothetical protein [Microlunatus antarcticus]|uniref:Uncharacterized protein n=1 Tax=Microlunatus antarcticus TaxID=53388 RepID=A0A7W5JX98_9ACTN|nr:hypothetical protein [Microlunatus antarcticus]MBB3328036.1 hypothetical protein [Microlunatus antarcticus]